MIELISSGTNTQLHTFPDLETKCTYKHQSDEMQDFQFFHGKNLFLSVNRSSGFELLRPYHSENGADIIQRVKKRSVNNVMCGATSSIRRGEVALGMVTGHINFFNLQSASFSPVKFNPEKENNAVIYLGYSNCDEMLASVYENGDINMYGLKTSVKMDNFRLGQYCTLLRFHPIKRFNLAVASYIGAVTVMDIQTKRILYQDKGAHSDVPCSDLCWSPVSPDTLFTVGYDCNINIFDVRRRQLCSQLKNGHPLSTVALSSCGNFCCAGNLKGELISYDLRNLKTVLTSKNVHNGMVSRVGFVPVGGDNKSSESDGIDVSEVSSTRRSTTTGISESTASISVTGKRSFPDNSNFRRESMLGMEVKTPEIFDCSVDSRPSLGRMEAMRTNRASRMFDTIILEDDESIKSEVSSSRSSIAASNMASSTCGVVAPPTMSKSNVLKETMPRNAVVANPDETPPFIAHQLYAMEVDKENHVVPVKKEFDPISKFAVCSTPNEIKYKPLMGTGDSEGHGLLDRAVPAECNGCEDKLRLLEVKMNERFADLEYKIINRLDNFSFSIHSNLWAIDDTDIHDLKEGMSALLRHDNFVQDYVAVKEENEMLKKRLEEMSRRY